MRRRQGSGHWAALATLLSDWRTEDCPLQVQVAPCAMCSTWAQPWLYRVYSPWALPTNKLTFSGQPWAGLPLVTGKILHWPSTTTTHHHDCVTSGQYVLFQHPIILSLDYDGPI